MNGRIEINSPAGTPEALRAAVEAGADAVYFGFRSASNLRNIPGLNFSVEEAVEGVRLAHAAGVKAFITVNTFPTDEHLPACFAAVDDAAGIGADAVIASDMAVLDYACSRYPKLALRLSCQAGAADADSIEFFRERFGIRAAILPRVLTVAEIAEIRKRTEVALEVFGFGTLCANYEGRCALSFHITGVSANNVGACAPADMIDLDGAPSGDVVVRLAGVAIDVHESGRARSLPTPCKGLYRDAATGRLVRPFLEPVSLDAMPLLGELAEAGIDGVKIEGRQRSATYVRAVTAAWRAAVDALDQEPRLQRPRLTDCRRRPLEAPPVRQRLADYVEGGECTVWCLASE